MHELPKKKKKRKYLGQYPHKNCSQLKQFKIKQKQKQILTKLNQHYTRSINSSGSTIPGNGAILMKGDLEVPVFCSSTVTTLKSPSRINRSIVSDFVVSTGIVLLRINLTSIILIKRLSNCEVCV